jgi:hypothetical protein
MFRRSGIAAPKVFFSYSRKDHDITQRLVSDLNTAGAEVWVDVDGIQSGNFMQAIDKALAPCAPGSIPPQWDVLQRYDASQSVFCTKRN